MTISTVVIGNESLLIGCCEALLARGHDIRAVVSTDAEITSWAASKGLNTHSKPLEIDIEFDWLLSIANLQVLPEAGDLQSATGGGQLSRWPAARPGGSQYAKLGHSRRR
ncbi:MAG: hypothetical protein EpisKO_31540 [Epibacterium sp.]